MSEAHGRGQQPPARVTEWAEQRQLHRQAGDYAAADALRERIEGAGWTVSDTPAGPQLAPTPAFLTIAPSTIPDRREEADSVDVSVLLLLEDHARAVRAGAPLPGWVLDDARRAATSVLRHTTAETSFEIIILDDGVGGEAGAWAADMACNPGVEAFHLAEPVGFARARLLQQRAATGSVLLWLDTGVELTGDVLGRTVTLLQEPTIGAVGGWGGDLAASVHAFEAAEPGGGVRDVDAVWGYLLALRRRAYAQDGAGPDEGFRFYRNVDADLSFQLRAAGWRTVVAELPAVQHVHRGYSETAPEVLERASRQTYGRLLERWRPQMQALVDQRAG